MVSAVLTTDILFAGGCLLGVSFAEAGQDGGDFRAGGAALGIQDAVALAVNEAGAGVGDGNGKAIGCSIL